MMTGIPEHRYDRDYHTCWCGKPWPCSELMPKSKPTRRLRHRFRMWLRKHCTRTMTRLEHGHGPGTLTRFGGTYPGYDWKCQRCGEHSEWGDE